MPRTPAPARVRVRGFPCRRAAAFLLRPLVAVAAVFLVFAVSQGAAYAAGADVIVFERYTPLQNIEDIYAVKAAGGPAGQLTNSPAISDVTPDVSPDGSTIASARSGPFAGIWTMNPDGSGLAAVPNTDDGISPAWSPGGERIAFTKGWGPQKELFVVDADGTGLLQLTFNGVRDAAPDWSPDGRSLVFHRYNVAESASAIMVLNLGTGAVSEVTGYTHIDSAPDWSVKNLVVFSRYLGAGDSDLYLIRPDGTGLHQLTAGPLQDNHPTWSPEGSHVAFARGGADEPDYTHIFRVRLDGTGLQQLTFGRVFDFFPSWGRWAR